MSAPKVPAKNGLVLSPGNPGAGETTANRWRKPAQGSAPETTLEVNVDNDATSYAALLKHADIASQPYIDDSTPDGHFGVTVKLLGVTTAYLLRGELGAEDATIVERTEYPEPGSGRTPNRYVGGGLKGGAWSRA